MHDAIDTGQQPRSESPVPDGLLCVQCGYELTGLPPDGACPECGTPVADSLRGNLLAHRSPDYVRTLTRGVTYVLNGIILSIIVTVVLFITGIAIVFASSAPSGPGQFAVGPIYDTLSTAINLAITALILWGFWLFAAPDPGKQTRGEPVTARQVVRVAVLTQAVCDGTVFLLTLVSAVASGAGHASALMHVSVAASQLATLIAALSFAAFCTLFFSSMLYIKGLAARLPSSKIRRLAASRIISCPIWSTVGIALFLLGPIIAIILYWSLLNMVRHRLRQIVTQQEYEAAPARALHARPAV